MWRERVYLKPPREVLFPPQDFSRDFLMQNKTTLQRSTVLKKA